MLAFLVSAILDFAESVSQKYKSMMMKLALQITGNAEDAEDAFQDALFSIHKNQHKIKDLDSDRARNYIYTVTRNAALKQKESAKKDLQHVTYLSEEGFISIEGEPDIDAFRNEYGFSEPVAEALKNLSQEDKDLICYYYGAEYSYREIARIMGCSAATLRKRMERCKRKLAQLLSDEYRGVTQ